uniref:Anoctamin n=1 Tax=Macrostomum lignano TaxID=282301 RepID=A0A1I8HHK0_9PLAT
MLDGGDIKADAGSIPSITVSNPVLQSEAVNAAASRTPFRWEETRLPHIDYVLVYKRDGNERNEKLREAFLDVLKIKRPGIDTEEFEYDGEFGQSLVFLKVYTPFHVLAKEAERLKLEMALDKSISPLESFNLSKKIGQCLGLIEDDEPDYISGPFTRNRLHLFKGHENTETFFRPALRSYLTYNILINADIGSNVPDVDKDVSKTALPKLLHRGAFIDAFILHDPSADDPWVSSLKAAWFKRHPDDLETSTANLPNLTTLRRASTPVARLLKSVRRIGECRFDYSYEPDERRRLGQVWSSLVKYQPLDRVRNYFGEKVAFYFAWSGHMISMLWAPMLIGLAIFLYGLALRMMALVDDMLATVKEAFDNLLTPIFAIIICLWGTLHTEMWKRYRATLAYEWDVNNYKHAEPDRPEFVGTMERPICVVFIGVAAVIVYRIFVTIRVCPNVTSSSCLLLNAVVSSLLNAVFIIVIGKVYNNIAYALTNWENHRTQSDYDNALILKLFAFEFANSYSSLFYIAFFR